MRDRLVIIGNGMAATRLVDELTARAPDLYDITIVGDEPRPAYNRVLLSSLLAGEIDMDRLALKPADWWNGRGARVIPGDAAIGVDRESKVVTLASGDRHAYDKLVFATGSRAIRLPKPGMDLPGVVTFRDLDDVEAILRAAGAGARAAVIGGGLLGLEAAYGLAKAGANVTLIHLMDRLMERQLDPVAAGMLRRALAAHGVDVVLDADTKLVRGSTRATGLELVDARVIEADLVICAVGIRPETALARAAGLAVNRGILVDDALATDDAEISALGECAEHRGAVYGLVEPAYEQARVLARALTGDAAAAYPGSTLATNLKVSGVGVFSAGDFMGAEDCETLIYSDPGLDIYKKLLVRDGRLAGAVLFGDTSDGPWYLDLIRSGEDISSIRDDLMFGRGLALSAAA